MLFSLCAHKKLSHFDFIFMSINKFKNQRLEIIHISIHFYKLKMTTKTKLKCYNFLDMHR